ncbi:filamentous hemagglutinin N-terminal domain-containing protein [Sulfuricurvum sp. RIFCSPLOWO2_12_FULL_43_24]|uniref:filamentous hemagglutinin N-terminal domain-containing protein n=1 Tax=Sulfuricurvum sp. RIFCSPLOWO2_12_FULL_43_24 TaxID=1802247 RepID=UPI0008C238E7|nr:filamentous hemagglutinin N-terminal domain-containing protein [Sulfuricurvum sp. RIFCSPLOWO2_12_FULL_43_24]OHD88503.1 MAG: hypothetical protein A3G19_06120 [Sulfuricurvum sp. RIFCSPLOWO2_12_FULL_43_24]
MRPSNNYRNAFRILKGGKISLVVSALVAGSTMTFASPSGGVVQTGTATISQSGSITNIDQSTQRASINWQSFSISSSETVNFNQPNSSAITLNRVVGNENSVINGALNANGQVWILNSNGILFGNGASINTAGLVASTMNMSDQNFMNGNFTFESTGSTASVINMGTIHVTDGAYVALLGKEVVNQGLIQATMGTVALTAGDKISLNFNGDSLVGIAIDQGTLNALVENKGAIIADGGSIFLTTNAAHELINGVVNNTGLLQAQTLDDVTGHIEVYAHGGTADIGGEIKAEGGFVETSADVLSVAEGTTIHAGEWLIDPLNVTIDAAMAATLEGQLASGDATVTTSVTGTDAGDINVNSAISWNANTLNLIADHDINVNAAMSATGTARLAMSGNVKVGLSDTGFAGKVDMATGTSLSINANEYTIINTLADLQGIGNYNSGKYVLGSNIDASATSTWNGGAGFQSLYQFNGKFDGLGHTITGLTINGNGQYVGLFGFANSADIRNTGMIDESIAGYYMVGGLVGYAPNTVITNSYATGAVSGTYYVGGLVGYGQSTTITGSYSSGAVSGTYYVGGLAGRLSSSTVTDSFVMGSTITGTNSVGAVIGQGYNNTLSNSFYNIDGTTVNGVHTLGAYGIYDAQFNDWMAGSRLSLSAATYLGAADANGYYSIDSLSDLNNMLAFAYTAGLKFKLMNNLTLAAGWYLPELHGIFDGNGKTISGLNLQLSSDNVGFVGSLVNGEIDNLTIADAAVSGNYNVGGLVGYSIGGTIKGSSVSGTVSGMGSVGGLVGYSDEGSVISNSSASATVTGTDWDVGGLIGYSYNNTITGSHASGTVTGVGEVGGLIGYSDGDTISDSYATGAVNGERYLGGLVGYAYGYIDQNYALEVSVDGLTPQQIAEGLTAYQARSDVQALLAQGYSLHTYSNGSYYEAYVYKNVKFGEISNSYATGDVTGTRYDIGGLVGYSDGATISGSYATGAVSGDSYVGGLIGEAYGYSDQISALEVTVDGLTPQQIAEGLMAYQARSDVQALLAQGYSLYTQEGNTYYSANVYKNTQVGSVSNSYETGAVNGSSDVGGLVGYSYGSDISGNYASGAVTGTNNVGGLVGTMSGYSDNTNTLYVYNSGLTSQQATDAVTAYQARSDVQDLLAQGYTLYTYNGGSWYQAYVTQHTLVGSLSDSYATGAVNGVFGDAIGGVVGAIDGAIITNTYAAGTITTTDSTNVGGVIGTIDNSTITDSFYDKTLNPTLTEDAMNVGKTTAELQTQSTFSNWDLNTVWGLDGAKNNGYPYLQWQSPATETTNQDLESVITSIINENEINTESPKTIIAMGTPITETFEGRDSLIQLTEGGVNLPEGIAQEFFAMNESNGQYNDMHTDTVFNKKSKKGAK